MRKEIWKFPLRAVDIQAVNMPFGAEILTVQVQGETPCLWAIVDPATLEVEERAIATHGTGHPMSVADRKYIGTYQLAGGALVFHVFELLR